MTAYTSLGQGQVHPAPLEVLAQSRLFWSSRITRISSVALPGFARRDTRQSQVFASHMSSQPKAQKARAMAPPIRPTKTPWRIFLPDPDGPAIGYAPSKADLNLACLAWGVFKAEYAPTLLLMYAIRLAGEGCVLPKPPLPGFSLSSITLSILIKPLGL